MSTRNLPAVWFVSCDGIHRVCVHCDLLSQTRKELEESGIDWISANCERHRKAPSVSMNSQNLVQKWLDKQNQNETQRND